MKEFYTEAKKRSKRIQNIHILCQTGESDVFNATHMGNNYKKSLNISNKKSV